MLVRIGLGLVGTSMILMVLGAALLALNHAQRPDHQTNLPYGLWARTRGGALEIGRYEHDGGWTGLFLWTSPYSIATHIPIMDGLCHVAVQITAPYHVRLMGGPEFDTRSGPRVLLRDETYPGICGGDRWEEN